ncbi:hypothetical protein LZZ90_01325 [Flavobacterium sp. SM15]|uniref:hypothetical protein n=1 Tax=Flavobacterium sp. SM15 TaxID=2908005 RepID=UPI001EDC4FC9|nr:hypothetical protein [Flavobacterium sp. SM15]MCG2610142.1 hypothetical protein [Flavobacterium sp. SM15]
MRTKTILSAVLIFSQISFAGNTGNIEEKKAQHKDNSLERTKNNKDIDVTKCCKKTASIGVSGQEGYQSIGVIKCVSASTEAEAQQMACLWAAAAAGAAIKYLANVEDTIITIR